MQVYPLFSKTSQIPPKPLKERIREVVCHPSDHFQKGVEEAAEVVTKVAGAAGGALVSIEGMALTSGLLASSGVAMVTHGPLGLAVAATAAGLSGFVGFKFAKSVLHHADKWGDKLAHKVGLSDQAGRTITKGTLALARCALLLGLGGLALHAPILLATVGVVAAGSALMVGGLAKKPPPPPPEASWNVAGQPPARPPEGPSPRPSGPLIQPPPP